MRLPPKRVLFAFLIVFTSLVTILFPGLPNFVNKVIGYIMSALVGILVTEVIRLSPASKEEKISVSTQDILEIKSSLKEVKEMLRSK